MLKPAFLTVFLLVAATASRAADFSREVRPGITSFKRITTGTRPQKIYAVRADLSSPHIGLHASADVVEGEWRTTTLRFAERVPDAVAAINGDWSCNVDACTGDRWLRPLGLAVSSGDLWNTHRVIRSNPGERWGYLFCTIDKQCTIKTRVLPLNNERMVDHPVQTPTVFPMRAFHAVGGNGLKMITDGVAGTGCFDSQSAPRSAVCLEADGTHLWIVVVDGRNAAGGETGMTCDEMRGLLAGGPFHCANALMLDGGGSSTLVVEDENPDATCFPRGARDLCVKNSPSDGSLRTVGNHLAITWTDAVDARCTLPSGRWCDGTRLTTCDGGRFAGTRDCAADAMTCQQDGATAFCVDARCPDGDGLRRTGCVDVTHLGTCNDGVFASTDCAAQGLVCGGATGSAGCMDARCPAPDGTACDGATWISCTAGTPTAVDCTAQGLACDPVAGCTAVSADAGVVDVDSGVPDVDAGALVADAGVLDVDAGSHAVDAGVQDDDDDDDQDDDESAPPRAPPEVVTGCAATTGAGATPLLLALGLRLCRLRPWGGRRRRSGGAAWSA